MKNHFESCYFLHPDARQRLKDILAQNGQPPILSIHRTKFHELIVEGKLPRPQKIGSVFVWRAGDLIAAINRLTTMPTEG